MLERRLEAEMPPLSKSTLRKAVILAAGSGQRLRPLTDNQPKCLVLVGGESILFRTLSTLVQYGIREVVIVIGHEGQKIIDATHDTFPELQVTFVWAKRYETTNNICSLWEARDHCDEDILLIESDVVFEGEVLRRMLEVDGNAMAIAPHRSWLSGTVVRTSEDRNVTSMFLGSDQDAAFRYDDTFKTANIYRLEKRFLAERYIPALCDEVAQGNVDSYYESILRDLMASGEADFTGVDIGDRLWYEVDDEKDLKAAEKLFAPPQQRLDNVLKLHGSYWRYGFTDHSYLYNLYFPPEEMLRLFQQDLRDIITNYPVGQDELCALVSAWTGAPAEQITVANGASELIKILGRELDGPLTIPVPSFNEYENVIQPQLLNRFYLDQSSFDLDVEAFADSAIRSRSKMAIVVTPNNPTSLSVPKKDLLYLAEKLRKNDCLLIVDESFVEFSCTGVEQSVQPHLAEHENLVLMKSMSKVFGIAGLRIGYALSSDFSVTEQFRREVPIWNINGLAEAFLRSIGEFKQEFFDSCERVKADRDDLYDMLLATPGIQPYRPDANFIFAKINHAALTGPDLVKRLFVEQNILVKDCAGKSMKDADRFVRIASRTPAENQRLVEAFRRLD